MTELLFVFTVVFVGYVLYEVFKTVSRPASAGATHGACAPAAAKTADTPAVDAAVAEPAEVAVAVVEESAPVAEESAAEEKVMALHNPATGETAAVPTNYRFAKKWIKEALVAEGLLDRIYKNAELEGDTSQKVKDALERLKGLAKYQA
ncbi:MAG: hypothetical protein PHT19_03690 [Methylococcus sp.]|nr:hypothetical protein [Methylococcus sp.]